MNSKLKGLREITGYSQKEIAEYLSISQPLYSQVENGNRPLRFTYIEALAYLYELTVEEMLNEDIETLKDKVWKTTEYKQISHKDIMGTVMTLTLNKEQ